MYGDGRHPAKDNEVITKDSLYLICDRVEIKAILYNTIKYKGNSTFYHPNDVILKRTLILWVLRYLSIKKKRSPQCCRVVFSAVSPLSTPQEAETETEHIEILFLLRIKMTQSGR